jgi:hypothetical protein
MVIYLINRITAQFLHSGYVLKKDCMLLLNVVFSLLQARGKIGSSLLVTDGARNISENNGDAGIILHLADSKVSIHTAFHDIFMCGSLAINCKYTNRTNDAKES